MVTLTAATPAFLERGDLDGLIAALRADDRTVIGPTLVDGAVVYEPISGAADLPWGQAIETSPGRYRVRDGDATRAFDTAVAVTSWKRFTHPPLVPQSHGRRDGDRVTVDSIEPNAPRLAFLGVRACEIAALEIQDRVLRSGPLGDVDHVARRDSVLIVAVECALAASTCFCTSTGTGPEVSAGADVVLAEVDGGFTARADTPAGARLLQAP